MAHPHLRFIALASSLLAFGCDSTPVVETPPIDWSALDAEFERVIAEEALEGATVAIVHRTYGLIHVRAYGDFEVDRVTLLASAGKMVSVGVIMRLADRGLIDLDAPISTYLGDLGQYKTDITIAQLLSNSSGLVGLIDDPTYAPYICQYLWFGTLASCASSIYTADDAADRVPPDTEFHYGGGQWQLAGGIAEQVSGKSWAELVDETYTKPCELDTLGYSNHFLDSISLEGPLAGLIYPPDFTGDPATLPVTENPNIEGGAYTTVRDYGELLLMHLRGGVCGNRRVLSEASVARMQEDRIGDVYGGSTGSSELSGYGLGWWIARERPGLVVDDGAYGATAWLDVGRGYGAVILIEDEFGSGSRLRDATQPIMDAIIDALPVE